MPSTDTIYTVEELCQIWKASAETIYKLLKSGQLQGFRVGREWRITEEAKQNYERGIKPPRQKVTTPQKYKIRP